MDDKEYYSIMNRTSSFVINQVLKKNKQKKQPPVKDWEKNQGRDDMEMLLEKKTDSSC